MAQRELYQANADKVIKHIVDFKWYPGFAISQKQKCIKSLHSEFSRSRNFPFEKIIEISSKSKDELGVALSAFNLKTRTLKGPIYYSVESAFQSSKVFENGGPYEDILELSSLEAKRDDRIKNSGALKSFNFFGYEFKLEPKTAFYDWLYINTLLKNPDLCEKIMEYRAFTDIEFNSKKQINSQAHSIALFVSLKLADIDMSDFDKPEIYLEKTKNFYPKKTGKQATLL